MRLSDEVTRVFGPYKDGNRWRIVVEVAGERSSKRYDTEADANDEKRKLLSAAAPAPKLWDKMREYFDYIASTGIKPKSVATLKFRLQGFFTLDQHPSELADAPITVLDVPRCQALYDGLAGRWAVDTHRNTLAAAKRFGFWCVKKGLLPTNPFVEIEPVGRRKRGKPQHHIDEARLFMATCKEHAANGDVGAIAAMTLLYLALRASELVGAEVRDLDDGGALLWIDDGKTEKSKRVLEVPVALQPWLRALAEGKAPTDRLFTDKDQHWVRYHVRRMCRLAGVREITSHALRGEHSTFATERGATGEAVAAALGHTDFGMTERHYLAPGTAGRSRQRRVGVMLEKPIARGARAHDAREPAAAVTPAASSTWETAPPLAERPASSAPPHEEWAGW